MSETSILVRIGGNQLNGRAPVVLLGPNGAGKSQAARAIVSGEPRRFIPAQRRTSPAPQLQILARKQVDQQLVSQLQSAVNHHWQPSNDIDVQLAGMLSEEFGRLTAEDRARRAGTAISDQPESRLRRLVSLWQRVYPGRELDFDDFAPKVRRTDREQPLEYAAQNMSDGERGAFYLAARVLSVAPGFLVVDEPELHFHRRLAIEYWDALEEMRPDVRFVYATHDLSFALSRAGADIFVIRSPGQFDHVVVGGALGSIPADLVEGLLGVATLSASARRFVFFEGTRAAGETGHGIAARFFRAWFDASSTVALGVGSRASVVAAVRALKESQFVTNGRTLGIVDRDHEAAAPATDPDLQVLEVHEVESLFVLPDVVRAVATHMAVPPDAWTTLRANLVDQLRRDLPRIAALRARAKIESVLGRAMKREFLSGDAQTVRAAHAGAMGQISPALEFGQAFDAEEAELTRLLTAGTDVELLRVLEGKALPELAARVCGMTRAKYVDLVVSALAPTRPKELEALGAALEAALMPHLPGRS